ncbi:uncharacterized protein LOC128739324 [Sabethes cyaneus]|uniref:uncharacterized protein LOC128739324 n=1 Tax=Sabethes cyaneus TaxID=53552 RepID=UPI00237DE609|nr:uncharacterized protein LOC128739324 [Sabethes cyaneus]
MRTLFTGAKTSSKSTPNFSTTNCLSANRLLLAEKFSVQHHQHSKNQQHTIPRCICVVLLLLSTVSTAVLFHPKESHETNRFLQKHYRKMIQSVPGLHHQALRLHQRNPNHSHNRPGVHYPMALQEALEILLLSPDPDLEKLLRV